MTAKAQHKRALKQSAAPSFWHKLLKGSKAKSPYYAEMMDVSQHYTMHEIGKPVWTTRRFDSLADEAYIKNVVAYRCISLIARSAAGVALKLSSKDEEGNVVPLHNHPLLKILNCPSPCASGREFMEAVYAYRLISGNTYILAVAPKDETKPTELHILRPDRVKVIAGRHGMPQGYQYTVDKQEVIYPVHPVTGESNVLHIKNFHPLNDWLGLSPIEAAAYSIDQHNQASQWNQALLQNGAKPSGALVVKSGSDGGTGHLTDEQFDRIKEQIDTHYSGAINAGRPLLLEGGLEWKEMSLSPKDMDFIDAKHSTARDIANAFGVPPQLLGIPGDNTYSNLVEARLALWEQTILPMLENTCNALNNWLVPRFENGLHLSYDTDEISALSPRREKVWDRIQNADFMTVNEKRRAVGLKPIDGGDELNK